MDKSHVSMEQHRCSICGADFDTGVILLHKRLAQTLEPKTITGMGHCPDCVSKLAEDRIALVECSAPAWGANKLTAGEANRTGRMAWMRREAFRAVFQTSGDGPDGKPYAMVFIEPGVIEKLAHTQEGASDET